MPDRPKNFSGVALAPAPDDYEILDGPTLGVRKISASARAHARNALAPRGGIMPDGSTQPVARSALPNQNIGTDDFSLVVTFRVPTSNPAASAALIGLSSSTSDIRQGIAVWLGSTGYLGIILSPDNTFIGGATNYAQYTATGFVSTFAGKVVQLVVTRSGAAVAAYVNGLPFSLGAPAIGGTGSFASAVTSSYLYVASGMNAAPAFPFYSATLYNLALSAADILEIFELGGAVPERFKWGTQIANYASDFSASTDGWGGAIGDEAVTGNVDGIGGVDNTLKVVMNSPGGRGAAKTFVLTRYKAYRVKCDAYMPSTNVGKVMAVDDGVSGFIEAAGGGTTKTLAGDTWTATAWTLVNNPSVHVGIRRQATGGGADELYLKNISFTQIGAILHLPLDDGGGYQLRDLSSNVLHAMMSTGGVTHVAPGVGPFRFRAKTNTSGSEQLQLAIALPANAQLLRVRARVQSGPGTPTVSLGTTSGGAQVATATGLNNTWKLLPLALPGGQVGGVDVSLWATSNTSDILEWDLAWEPQSF